MMIRDVLAAMLVAAAPGAIGISASCGGGATGGAGQEISDVSKDKNQNASQELRALSAHPALEILIRTGTQHWAQGEITLVVRGTGAVTVTQRQATDTASFAGQLPSGELDAFGQTLDAHRFTAARRSAQPREPGDTPVVLQLHRGDETAFAAELWDADRETDADLDAILGAAAQLIHRVSAGKLGQP